MPGPQACAHVLAGAALALPRSPARASTSARSRGSPAWFQPDQLERAARQRYLQIAARRRWRTGRAGLEPQPDPAAPRSPIISSLTEVEPVRWKWRSTLFGSKQVNAFCVPGSKIATILRPARPPAMRRRRGRDGDRARDLARCASTRASASAGQWRRAARSRSAQRCSASAAWALQPTWAGSWSRSSSARRRDQTDLVGMETRRPAPASDRARASRCGTR